MIDLSVVIPVYNGEALLARCLDSVLDQKTQYRIEVWLIDDGSDDGSVALAEKLFRSRTLGPTGTACHILCQQNGGPAKARNWGIREATGRYIAFLDADDYWDESYVEKTVSFLDSHSACVAVNVVCKNVAVSGISYNPDEKIICTHNKKQKTTFILDDFYSYWAKWCHVGTCSTTMRAIDAKSVLMREDLRISEDYEFWLMLAGLGRWAMILEPLYVSDGTGTIDTQEAWLRRMRKRWENAPTLSEWERRIVGRYPALAESENYLWARGRVARNLTYCQLLSGRDGLSRQETLKYGKYFIDDPIGKLMNLCKWTPLLWKPLCVFLRYREYHRF